MDQTRRADRFRPTRAGIINVWDYRDEEFVFADGRLVLRGPNGSGKTKALEVLFPFVLDGRIEPRRLNPFAGEDRTMKSNLLYRGQETAHGYVWMEFARGDGPGEVLTVGAGLRAQKHSERIVRWYFVVPGRVGVDFSLLAPDDRPLTRKQLVAEVGADAVTDRPAEHRAAVDARLFGLGAHRYEQLLTLVLTLRRPQLAKHLDPKSLSRTLAGGLRPLDDELITEAARSFDDMESVQRTLDGLVQADNAVAAFLATYTTYLRTHARATADVVARRRNAVEQARLDLAKALAAREAAETRRAEADATVARTERALREHREILDSLQQSTAYEHKGQLDKLNELVRELESAARQAQTTANNAAGAAANRTREWEQASQRLEEARHEITRCARTLSEHAEDAGIDWSAVDAAGDTGFRDRVSARLAARRADVHAVRASIESVRDARRTREQFEEALSKAEAAVAGAEDGERQATARLENARATALDELGRWWSRHERMWSDMGSTVDTAESRQRLVATLDVVGEPDAPTPETTFDELTRAAVQAHERERHRLTGRRDQVAANLADLREQRELVASERDDAPAPFAARTASRTDRPGAPLWRLVRFADDLPAERAAAVEAALAAANLLDAWVDPDDDVTIEAVSAGVSDGYLLPLPSAQRPKGPTLADVLIPELGVEIDAQRIREVLDSVALSDTVAPGVTTISVEGAFGQGVQVGAHTKPEPEYVGATARARRRAARLAELDQQIGATTEHVAELDAAVERIGLLLDAVADARAELPRTGPIAVALRRQAEAAGELRASRTARDAARTNVDRAVAEVGNQERRLARTAAEHRLSPDDVDRVAEAIDRFRGSAHDLASARETEASRAEDLAQAQQRRTDAEREAVALAGVAEKAERTHSEQAAGLAALRDSVGEDVDKVMNEINRTKQAIVRTDDHLASARDELNIANSAAGEARAAVTGSVRTLTNAISEAQTDARRLAPYAHREILELLRVPAGLGWPTAAEDWPNPAEQAAQVRQALTKDPAAPVFAIPAAVTVLHDAIGDGTAELSPTESSLKSSKTRLSSALDTLQTQLSAASHDYHPEWDADQDVITVRVADETGYPAIADFARRIADARRDQEQLLTESERRVLEDALLGRLAQQIHERTVDARDLITRMSTEMRTRRMSSGVTIGVHWELADALDEEQRDICRLLDRDATRLGPDDLARMRGHFASRIKTARAQHPDRSYAELLAEVLDYRDWRTFGFTLVAGDGSEERLTQSRHGTLSGGEQAVSLHLPLFAAAHVTLSSAHEHCPRLLALDEAFAGVDDTGRRELLGLTAQFDLDLFMTGYDLWATYDTVPGCAHFDLLHSATEHTVNGLLLVWDGKEVLADGTEDLAAALGSPGTRRRRTATDTTLLETSPFDDQP